MNIPLPNPVQYSAWIDLNTCHLRPDARFHPEDELESLAKSMDIKQLVPIIVCHEGENYEVLAGVGRFLAAQKRQWKQIRADVYEGLTEIQKLNMIFSENEDRNNASPLYQAQILHGMMQAGQLTQAELAEAIRKSQQSISDYLSLLSLSPKIWENTSALVNFSMRHFRQLLRIENQDEQWKLAEIARAKDLTSSELGALVDEHLGVKSRAAKAGRPKGDKTVGAEGFVLSLKGKRIGIKALYDPDEDLGTFLKKLEEAILSWRTAHAKAPLSPEVRAAVAEEISKGGLI